MPEISRFYGIVIAMFYNDHEPPHFHARYGDARVLIAIETLAVLRGQLPQRAMGLLLEWASRHRDARRANWRRARAMEPLAKVEPLE